MNSKFTAIVLVAGTSSRLRPLTDYTPKCLLEVGNQPILEKTLTTLLKSSLQKIILVTGYLAPKIDEFIQKKFPNERIEIIHNPIYATTNNAYSLKAGLKDEVTSFILLDGDLVFSENIFTDLLKHENALMTDHRKERLTEEAMKVVTQKNSDAILKLSKQATVAESAGEYIGMASFGELWTTALKTEMKKLNLERDGNSYYEDILNRLIPTLPPLTHPSTHQNYWTEIDTPEDLEKCRSEILHQKINFYTTKYAGTPFDLDKALEVSSIEDLLLLEKKP